MKRNGATLGAAFLAFLLAAAPLGAQTLDAASSESLAAALRMLQDPSLRDPAVAADPRSAAVDKQIQGLAGSPQLTHELYELAAQVLSELTHSSGGDVRQMTEAIERGQADPAAFASMLSPATLQRLRDLSVKISDQQRPRR